MLPLLHRCLMKEFVCRRSIYCMFPCVGFMAMRVGNSRKVFSSLVMAFFASP
jgi:hypothetical protein